MIIEKPEPDNLQSEMDIHPPPALVPVDVPMRRCNRCFEEKPLTMFYRRKHGKEGRFRQCSACADIRAAEWRSQNRTKVLHRRAMKAATRLANEHDINRMAALISDLMLQFGGFDALSEELGKYYQTAKPGTTTRFKVAKVVFNLMEMLDRRREQDRVRHEGELSAMSQEQLEDDLEGVVRSYVAANPEAAIIAAHALGWTVIPPE